MWPETISIPTQRGVIGNSEGEGVSPKGQNCLSLMQNWNSRGMRVGSSNQKPSMGGAWIFPGTAHLTGAFRFL